MLLGQKDIWVKLKDEMVKNLHAWLMVEQVKALFDMCRPYALHDRA